MHGIEADRESAVKYVPLHLRTSVGALIIGIGVPLKGSIRATIKDNFLSTASPRA